MSEDMIELIYEKSMDKLDKLLINNHISQDEYDEEVRELNNWVSSELKGEE